MQDDFKYQLSVIIPALNEASHLPVLLRQLNEQVDIELEVILSDGGSTDGTRETGHEFGANVLEVPRGRAIQLNVGARTAKYENLLFLHADSQILDPRTLRNALEDWINYKTHLKRYNVAGHFPLKFSRSQGGNEWAFRYIEEKTSTGRLQTINGDQGFLINKKYFDELGEFDENMSIMEDQVLAQKVFETGYWYLLPGQLTTSGRRFEVEGFHKRYILLSLMMGLYWTGTHEFFKRARDVYKDQQDADKLQLSPFWRAIWQMLIHDLGLWGSVKAWFKVGRYVRQNSWQMFFFFDVAMRPLLGPKKYPMTWFHDHIFYPITNNWLCDLINTVFVVFWYMAVLGPYFYLTENILVGFKRAAVK